MASPPRCDSGTRRASHPWPGPRPGGRSGDPVSLADVLLAAVAEVEDHVRVGHHHGIRRRHRRDRGERRHPPRCNQLVENATALLPCKEYPGGGQRQRQRQQLRRGDRGPRARHGSGRRRRRQRAPGQPTPSSTWPTASGSACSWSVSSPPGTGSRWRCVPPTTAGSRPSCCSPARSWCPSTTRTPGSHTALSASCRLRPRTGPVHEAGKHEPTFGMGGRHHRLSLPGSSPEADPAGGSGVRRSGRGTAHEHRAPAPGTAAARTGPAAPGRIADGGGRGPGPLQPGSPTGARPGHGTGQPWAGPTWACPGVSAWPAWGRVAAVIPAAPCRRPACPRGGPVRPRPARQPDVRAAGRIAARTPRRPGLPRRLPGILRRASGRRSGR